MKNTFLYKITPLILIFTVVFSQSCTNLDEELFSDINESNFFQNDEQFVAGLGAAYTALYFYGGHNGLWSLNEVSSDEFLIAQKGSDWFDGGQWLRVHQHLQNSAEESVGNAWNSLFSGVTTCNRLIEQFESAGVEGSDAFISELTALRAWFYYQLLDTYGNVPVVSTFATAEEQPATRPRAEVFSFVEADLVEASRTITRDLGPDTYARMQYYAAQFLLAKIYLNAEVYTGSPRWEDCIAACDNIINSGQYSLSSDFFANFSAENEGSPENIFVIPYDQVGATGFNWSVMHLLGASQSTFNLTAQPWNGYATLQEFYEMFTDDDVRKQGFLVGPQFTSAGDPVLDASFDDPDGEQVNYTPEINELEPNSWRQGGARQFKYQYELGATEHLNNDFALMRYGDVLLMKAEALWRLGRTGEALTLVNEIRARAGVTAWTAAELTANNFLAERGREMFAEGYRRSDLIRFGKFNDPWQFKAASDPTKNLMPIPVQQLDANPSLVQNPGY